MTFLDRFYTRFTIQCGENWDSAQLELTSAVASAARDTSTNWLSKCHFGSSESWGAGWGFPIISMIKYFHTEIIPKDSGWLVSVHFPTFVRAIWIPNCFFFLPKPFAASLGRIISYIFEFSGISYWFSRHDCDIVAFQQCKIDIIPRTLLMYLGIIYESQHFQEVGLLLIFKHAVKA